MSKELRPIIKEKIENLPSVRVGTIINLYWTNGSFEGPSNPIDFADILSNFIEKKAKIDWINNDSGLITLSGDFNYLVFNDGEYFFLEKTRILDIKKQKFVYTCIRDMKQTMLTLKNVIAKGTLVKTIDKGTLTTYLDFTKSLTEDSDEILTYPISESAEKISVPRHSLKPLNIKEVNKSRVFTTNTLNRLIDKMDDTESHQVLTNLKNKKGKIKLLIGAELTDFTPSLEVIKKVNEWLKSPNLRIMSSSTTQLSRVSPKLNTEFASYKGIYFLTKISGTDIQEKRIVEGNLDDSKVLDSNFFTKIKTIKPVGIQTLQTEYLNNKSIFQVSGTDGRVFGGFTNWFELKPRAYTSIANFKQHNDCSIVEPLRYSVSKEGLERLHHMDTSGNQTDSLSKNILNFVSVSYFPDFWQNKSWNNDNLQRLVNAGLGNINPTVGFLLYDIWDYWNLTRGDRVSRSDFNVCNQTSGISELKIVNGLKYYAPEDTKSEIDLIAEAKDENFKTFKKSTKKINFGLISSDQAKLPTNLFYLNSLYTFYKDPVNHGTDLEEINNQHASNFGATFIAAHYIADKTITASIKTNRLFNWNGSISSDTTEVEGISNLELIKACYNTYNKIKKMTTLTKTISIPKINYGDYFWSNAAWVFAKDTGSERVDLKKPQVVLLFGPDKHSYSSYDFRISKLSLIDPEPEINKIENLIRSDDPKQLNKESDIYPWIVKETQMDISIAPVKVVSQTDLKNAKERRNNQLREFYQIIIDYVENLAHNETIYYTSYRRGDKGEVISRSDILTILKNSVGENSAKDDYPLIEKDESDECDRKYTIKFYTNTNTVIASVWFRLAGDLPSSCSGFWSRLPIFA